MTDDFDRMRGGLPLARDPKCTCDHGPLDHDSHGCVACPCTVYHLA